MLYGAVRLGKSGTLKLKMSELSGHRNKSEANVSDRRPQWKGSCPRVTSKEMYKITLLINS